MRDLLTARHNFGTNGEMAPAPHMIQRIFLITILALTPFFADAAGVIINEIGWSGTKASSYGEWIELYNNSDAVISLDGWALYEAGGATKIITLSGAIDPKSYYLVERTTASSPDPLADITVDRRGLFGGSGLSNEGEDLFLIDASSTTVDAVKFSSGWPAGTIDPDYVSMERIDPAVSGSKASNWASNKGIKMNGKDADGNLIHGTPRSENSGVALVKPVLTFVPVITAPKMPISEKGRLSSGVAISEVAPEKIVVAALKPTALGATNDSLNTAFSGSQAGDGKGAVEGNSGRSATNTPDQSAVANMRASSISFVSSRIFLLASIGLGLFGSVGYLVFRSL